MVKCDSCIVWQMARESNEPACCAWYMENVVCGEKSVDDCDEYEAAVSADDFRKG